MKRGWHSWILLLGIGALVGCRASSATAPRAPIASTLAATPQSALAVKPAPEIVPVAYSAPTIEAPPRPSETRIDSQAGPVRGELAPARVETYPIDLPTALRLADSGNYQVAYAREQISQAWARVDAAESLWLPSIRGGLGYNKHEGQIQDIVGEVFPKSRGNIWSGLGAGVPGAGSPVYPGAYANFHLSDALFEPLAARQGAAARQHAAAAVTNDVLLRVALAYLELARAAEDVAISAAAVDNHQALADLTAAYATSGQGAQAEADRASTELSLRRNDLLRAEEAYRVASARLAQLVRLNADVVLEPVDPVTVPIELVPPDVPVGELIAEGLSMRHELAEARHLASQAAQKMRREQYSILLPSVVLGASYGGFGGGQGATIANYGDRFDADVIAYWQMRNLGLGDRAARAEAASVVRQTNVQHMALMDQVAREVVEAQAQVQMRRGQIAIARQAVESATLSHQRNLERIKQFQGLPIEMLQANQALTQARRDYLRTLIDYNAAQFTLYRAIGAPGKFADCETARRRDGEME